MTPTEPTGPLVEADPATAHELTALYSQLRWAWTAQTSADPAGWTSKGPSYGQCAVTALVVQRRFGGELLRTVNAGVSHYFNRLPSGHEVDLTRDQFDVWAPTEPVQTRTREYVLSHPDTAARYALLSAALGVGPVG